MTSSDPDPLPAPSVPPTQVDPPPLPPSPTDVPDQPPYGTPARSAPKGWPGSAKVTAIVLAVTTAGAATAGVLLAQSAKSDTSDVKHELSATRKDLEAARTAAQEATDAAEQKTKSLQDALDGAEADLSDAESNLSDAQDARDAEAKKAEALRNLFPLDLADLAASGIQGRYTVSVIEGSAVCTGYADNDLACAVSGFPGTIEIAGDATSGLTVSSPFFDPVGLTEAAGHYVATGDVTRTAADRCNNLPSPTTFVISISIGEVALGTQDQLDASRLYVDFSMGAEASTDCTATSRSAQLSAVAA